jgi:hypothetical protein
MTTSRVHNLVRRNAVGFKSSSDVLAVGDVREAAVRVLLGDSTRGHGRVVPARFEKHIVMDQLMLLMKRPCAIISPGFSDGT